VGCTEGEMLIVKIEGENKKWADFRQDLTLTPIGMLHSPVGQGPRKKGKRDDTYLNEKIITHLKGK